MYIQKASLKCIRAGFGEKPFSKWKNEKLEIIFLQ